MSKQQFAFGQLLTFIAFTFQTLSSNGKKITIKCSKTETFAAINPRPGFKDTRSFFHINF